ncbi:hypothetical protein RI129_010893 [Pyrocoelia pectoralis]|uniref:Ubiquinone biosynthesis protein n=1 Tax=Pyrocoelia pectoralis TaxID=417401 RepID=A0AAN7ZE33_9COLE
MSLLSFVRCSYKNARLCLFVRNSSDETKSRLEDQYEEEIKLKILDASLPFVVELGWSVNALSAGAESIGYPGIVHGIFPRSGADLVYHFQKSSNQKLVEYLKQQQQLHKVKPLHSQTIVEEAVRERLKMVIPYLSRWPQALAVMSLPQNVSNSLATLLTMVDDVCYYAGDQSVDFNWYARRVTLAGIYKATELHLIQDTSANYENTWKFLNNRITELTQVYDLINTSDLTKVGTADTVKSAFITARNILGLNR